jgi:hypothetical protein
MAFATGKGVLAMQNREPENRNMQTGSRQSASTPVWLLAVLGVMIVLGLVVWMTSNPSNRVASSPDASTTGTAPKSPPASSSTDPATQSSSR